MPQFTPAQKEPRFNCVGNVGTATWTKCGSVGIMQWVKKYTAQIGHFACDEEGTGSRLGDADITEQSWKHISQGSLRPLDEHNCGKDCPNSSRFESARIPATGTDGIKRTSATVVNVRRRIFPPTRNGLRNCIADLKLARRSAGTASEYSCVYF